MAGKTRTYNVAALLADNRPEVIAGLRNFDPAALLAENRRKIAATFGFDPASIQAGSAEVELKREAEGYDVHCLFQPRDPNGYSETALILFMPTGIVPQCLNSLGAVELAYYCSNAPGIQHSDPPMHGTPARASFDEGMDVLNEGSAVSTPAPQAPAPGCHPA